MKILLPFETVNPPNQPVLERALLSICRQVYQNLLRHVFVLQIPLPILSYDTFPIDLDHRKTNQTYIKPC